MHGREFVNDMLTSYFTLVTLISVVMLVLGLKFNPDASFGYAAYAVPLIYGACGILPNVVMYSRHELTIKEFLVRKVIQLILTEVVILFVVFGDILAEDRKVVIATGIGVFIVYVVAHIIDWIQECLSAKKMTEDLIKLQQSALEQR